MHESYSHLGFDLTEAAIESLACLIVSKAGLRVSLAQ